VSVPDRCTICAECTTCSEIIPNTHDRTTSDVGHVESCFGSFGDTDNLDAR
jgi:hypothetical protein